MLTLNKKIDGFGGTEGPYKVLYTVRVNETEYLVPDVNGKDLKDIAQLDPASGFAYERIPIRIRRMNPLKLPRR